MATRCQLVIHRLYGKFTWPGQWIDCTVWRPKVNPNLFQMLPIYEQLLTNHSNPYTRHLWVKFAGLVRNPKKQFFCHAKQSSLLQVPLRFTMKCQQEILAPHSIKNSPSWGALPSPQNLALARWVNILCNRLVQCPLCTVRRLAGYQCNWCNMS